MEALRVLVIVDRQDRPRGEFWQTALREIHDKYNTETEVLLWPLSDKLHEPLTPDGQVLIRQIEESDVLILNWDVLNGDPEFGADLARRWFEHRWPAIRGWLASGDGKKGHVLIIEGQAVLGVPDVGAYSAVLGPREVAVSGIADPWRPDAPSLSRMVGECRMTRAARRAPGFQDLSRLAAKSDLDFGKLFPKTVGRLLPSGIRKIRYSNVLYRGWFQRRFRQRTLRWVAYARRAKPWPLNYATLLGAKVNDNGIIFATTMLLSATQQLELITALLEASGRVSELPDPGRARRWIGKYLPRATAALLAALIALSFTSDPWMRALVTFAAGLVALVFFDFFQKLWRKAYLAARTLRGY